MSAVATLIKVSCAGLRSGVEHNVGDWIVGLSLKVEPNNIIRVDDIASTAVGSSHLREPGDLMLENFPRLAGLAAVLVGEHFEKSRLDQDVSISRFLAGLNLHQRLL